jgi:2-amino-4-hydroxy-6-hydroxymethyldihydropteridine diphosphokinase
MHVAYLLLGSNQGDRPSLLKQAIAALGTIGEVQKRSGLYETAAWGLTDQPAFLNQAICLHTAKQPLDLLEAILDIEKELGRERIQRYGPRTIDIDILLFDRVIMNAETLSIPHPALPNRRFALTPLSEIASDLLHPEHQLSIHELLLACPRSASRHTDQLIA